MRIALILLPNWTRRTPSLGIAYLSSHLKKAGHFVSRLELNLRVKSEKWFKYLESINNKGALRKKILDNTFNIGLERWRDLEVYVDFCVNTILETNPEVVAFSVYSCNVVVSLLVAQKIKLQNNKIPIIFGGPDMSISGHKKEYLSTGWVDYVMLGEGERSLPHLLNNIESGETSDFNGWTPEKDIDQFEFPTFLESDINNSKFPFYLPIISNRGCVGNCDFCYETRIWKTFRQRSPKNVLQEIKQHMNRHNINNFNINDSSINSDSNFIVDFSNKIIDEGINIRWGGNGKIRESLNFETLKLMHSAGCRFLRFGVESGSNSVLKSMNKGINVDLIEDVLRNAHENGIWVHIYLIIGHPAETESDFIETIKFVARNRNVIDSLIASKFITYKKTIQTDKIDMLTRREEDFKSIFKVKGGVPPFLFLENNRIDFKSSKKPIYNTTIHINKLNYERVTGEKYDF